MVSRFRDTEEFVVRMVTVYSRLRGTAEALPSKADPSTVSGIPLARVLDMPPLVTRTRTRTRMRSRIPRSS